MNRTKALTGVATLAALFAVSWQPNAADAAAETTWTKHDSLVMTDARASFPRVIKEDTGFSLIVADQGAVYVSTSSDGKTWSALEATNIDGSTIKAHEPWVMKDGANYRMWYNCTSGGGACLGHRMSSDGFTWTNGVEITPGGPNGGEQAWDTDYISPVVIKDGDTYKMWYNANEGNGKFYIAYATSTDGYFWTEPQNLGQVTSAAGNTNNNLVLKQGDAGAWDGYQSGEALYGLSVLKNEDGTYEMWYSGNKSGEAQGADGYSIGYARSTDGINWTKHMGNPVIKGTVGGYDAGGAYYPTVIEDTNPDSELYHMFYWAYNSGWDGKLAYASAPIEGEGDDTPTPSEPTAPSVSLTDLTGDITVTSTKYTVKGKITGSGFSVKAVAQTPTVKVTLNDVDQGNVEIASDGSFSKDVTLKSGANTLVVTATDSNGKTTTVTRTITAAVLASTGLSVWYGAGLAALFLLGLWLVASPKRQRA